MKGMILASTLNILFPTIIFLNDKYLIRRTREYKLSWNYLTVNYLVYV